jgi:hypothetical protein
MFNKDIQDFFNNNHMYQSEDAICYCDTNGSTKLLITIGESWTWGDSLDSDLRLQQVWGKCLSKKLNCDWLNIARKGASNFWIFYQIAELVRFGKLPYTDIQIVFCCTESGREYNENWNWYQTNPCIFLQHKKFETLTDSVCYFNKCLIDTLTNDLQKLQPVEILITHNFCGTTFWHHRYQQLNKNWVNLTTEKLGVEFDYEVPTIGQYNHFRSSYRNLNTAIEMQTKSLSLVDFLTSSPYNYKQASKHPTAESHEFWADYIFNQLVSQE